MLGLVGFVFGSWYVLLVPLWWTGVAGCVVLNSEYPGDFVFWVCGGYLGIGVLCWVISSWFWFRDLVLVFQLLVVWFVFQLSLSCLWVVHGVVCGYVFFCSMSFGAFGGCFLVRVSFVGVGARCLDSAMLRVYCC